MTNDRDPVQSEQGGEAILVPSGFPTGAGRDAGVPLVKYSVQAVYVVLLMVGYYLMARLGLAFRIHNSQIGVVWPANAVLLSALLLAPRSRWWIVFTVAALAHVAAVSPTTPLWRAGWQIAGNTVFTMATAEVLRRFVGLPLHFGTRRQVLAYTAVSFVMPVLYGFATPSFVRTVLGLESFYTPTLALFRTALSNSTALLLVAPAILLWAQSGARLYQLRRRRILEAVAVTISLLVIGLLTLAAGPEIACMSGVLFWVFPPLLWAAVRFGPLGASTSLLIVAALSGWATSRQLGPFAVHADADNVLSLQLFWMALCPPVALIAAVIRERDVVEHDLQDQRSQLAHVTRVATAGELSAALAHELRQPLTSIYASAEAASDHLKQRAPNLDEVRAILKEIMNENKQAAGIIARVDSFLRKDGSHFQPLVIETVVRDALVLGRNTINRSGVMVQTHVAGGVPRVNGDSVQLLQVLLNLIVNACESMSSMPSSERHLRLQIAATDHEHVEVLVADCGPGLPAGAEEKIFEPFHTTKDKGLGLGLAIARSIAAAHGGRLWGENNPHGGATFHLVLPTNTSAG
jgi:signal transduction histidine kinase